jgi:hypothetical protein
VEGFPLYPSMSSPHAIRSSIGSAQRFRNSGRLAAAASFGGDENGGSDYQEAAKNRVRSQHVVKQNHSE